VPQLEQGDAGYFGTPGTPGNLPRLVTDNNVLWGDSFYINKSANKAYAQNLVAIKSAGPTGFTPGQYTFYGRYDYNAAFFSRTAGAAAWQAYDGREPLPTTFLSRYINGDSPDQGVNLFNSGTTEVVWRDSKVDQAAFTCPARFGNPFWYGLSSEGIAIFDELEHVITPPPCRFSPCQPQTTQTFPAEAQRVGISSDTFVNPSFFKFSTMNFDAGFLWLDLNHGDLTTTSSCVLGNNSVACPGLSTTTTPPLTEEADAWVGTTYANTSARAGISSLQVGERAFQVDTGNTPNHCTPTSTTFPCLPATPPLPIP
jgi:hypothetical protein